VGEKEQKEALREVENLKSVREKKEGKN